MVGRLMFLVDTNIWLELLLKQEKADEVRIFFENVEANQLAITEFSLYSLGIILTNLKKDNIFKEFLEDTLENSGVAKIRLETHHLKKILDVRKKYGLDFDDSYQYVSAEEYGYTIVSFDKDFDSTILGKKTPSELTSKK